MMNAKQKTYELTPAEAYQLMIAALDVIAGCSASVSKRVRRAIAKGESTAYPTINPTAYAKLAETLEGISPGIIDRLFKTDADSGS